MKNGITTIMRKELARFFGDKRVLLTTLLLPGLMIYVVYTFMGDAITNASHTQEDYVPSVYAQNLPDSIAALSEEIGFNIQPADNIQEIKQSIQDKNTDLLLAFPADFDAQVAAYDPLTQTLAPNIELFYNSATTESSGIFNTFYALLDNYEATLANKFDVNNDIDGVYDLATQEDSSAFIISGLMPMLLMMFLFIGCMNIAPESIAGEKERGTIATLLVTPLKRRDLAIGKLLSLSILSLLCGLSSCIGTMLALPKLMGSGLDQISLNIYSAVDYLLLGTLIASTVLLLVALLSIISAFAKTIKEATTAVTPLMLVVMLIGASAMFSRGAQTQIGYYFVPLYNSVQSLVGIFSRDYEVTNIVAAIAGNLLLTGLGGFVLTKMFNNEKVVFSK